MSSRLRQNLENRAYIVNLRFGCAILTRLGIQHIDGAIRARSGSAFQQSRIPNTLVLGLARFSYDELRQLPLRAYVTGGLYLSSPFNFRSRAIDPQHETTEYLCDFMDGDYLVKVVVDLESRAVTVTQ